MFAFARLFLGLGLLFLAIGAILFLCARAGVPLGRLPGDFNWRGKHISVHFPLASSLLLSALLSLLLYLAGRFRR